MAAPTVTGTSRGSVNGTTGTLSHTSDGNPLWVIALIFGSGIPVHATCTYGGTAMVHVLREANTNNTFQLFKLDAPSAGTANVVITPPGSSFMALGVYNIQGAAPAVRVRHATGASTAPTVTIASATDELIIDAVYSDVTSQTWAAAVGQTELFEIVDVTNNAKIASSYKAGASPTVTMAYTLGSSDTWGHTAVAFIPATGGSGGGASAYVFVG